MIWWSVALAVAVSALTTLLTLAVVLVLAEAIDLGGHE